MTYPIAFTVLLIVPTSTVVLFVKKRPASGRPSRSLDRRIGGAYRIFLTGQDLADLAAFAHDRGEQSKLTIHEVPREMREMMQRHRL